MFHNLNWNLSTMVTSWISVCHRDQIFKEIAISAEMIILKYRVKKTWRDLEECLILMRSIRERRLTERLPLFRMRFLMKIFQTLNLSLFIRIAPILKLKIFSQLQEEELILLIEMINFLSELQPSIKILRFK